MGFWKAGGVGSKNLPSHKDSIYTGRTGRTIWNSGVYQMLVISRGMLG